MKKKLLLMLIIGFVLLTSSIASAMWEQTPVTYYNNYDDSAVISNLELTNPSDAQNFTYVMQQDSNNWYFYKGSDTLVLDKTIFNNVVPHPDRISFNITATKSQIIALSTANGTSERYIVIPKSIQNNKFLFDNKLPDVLIEGYGLVDPSTFYYSTVNGKLRFNFQTSPYASLASSTKIKFIFDSWYVDNAIVGGLGDVGSRSIPAVFTNNSKLYLISGESTGVFFGFNWTGTTWQSDASIVTGLPDIGTESSPTVFSNNSKLYLISGDANGIFTGYNLSGGVWQSDASIVSGLTDVGSRSKPKVFSNNSKLYLISGNSAGAFTGFNWTGSVWQSDAAIVTGLAITGTYSSVAVFLNNSKLDIIVGNDTGYFFGFNRTGSVWVPDSKINESLSSVGAYSAPEVFINNSVLYLVTGKGDGTFSGYNDTVLIIPPNSPNSPIANTLTTGNFWKNLTWTANNTNTITNSYNVSVNGTWTNGTTATFKNNTTVPHGWLNYTVYSFNNTIGISSSALINNTQISNNAPVQGVIGNKNGVENSWLNFTINSTDADGDVLTYADNTSKGTLSGYNFSWKPTLVESGTYYVMFNTTDTYGGVDYENITITIAGINFIPGTPTMVSSITGNFWDNNTWQAGAGNATNFYNVSVNGTWTNGSSTTFKNTTTTPHGWVNLTVYGYNTSYGNLSLALTNNTQIPNNPITISNISSSYSLGEGQTLTIDANYADADGDTGTFNDNSSKWTINSASGVVSWTTTSGDAGTYYNLINVTDGYGSIANYNFTVIVTSNTPGIPNTLTASTSNFWVNYTWNAGINTDTFNVSYNGTWTNGSALNYINRSVPVHGWGNITVFGYNTTVSVLGTNSVSSNTQVPNNPITIGNVSSSYSIVVGDLLAIYPNSTDLDGDSGTFIGHRLRNEIVSTYIVLGITSNFYKFSFFI